jgi:hypothetical protein
LFIEFRGGGEKAAAELGLYHPLAVEAIAELRATSKSYVTGCLDEARIAIIGATMGPIALCDYLVDLRIALCDVSM